MKRFFPLSLLALLAGCAQFPDGTGTVDDTRVIFRMTVAGEIRPDYVYIVAIRAGTDPNPTTIGPSPVVEFPNANGFVAGNATHFVRWDPLQSRAYILYRFTDNDLISFREVGIPIDTVDVTPRTDTTAGSRTLGFEISTAQLSDTVGTANQLQSLQVNFLTMNRTSQQNAQGRIFDALGDTRTASEIVAPVRIPLATSGVYNNSRFNQNEPAGDSPDPDVDITDWSVEVRRQ